MPKVDNRLSHFRSLKMKIILHFSNEQSSALLYFQEQLFIIFSAHISLGLGLHDGSGQFHQKGKGRHET